MKGFIKESHYKRGSEGKKSLENERKKGTL